MGLLALPASWHSGAAALAPRGAPTASHGLSPFAGGLHGDLVVTAANSPYVISPAVAGVGVYYQAGNITVQTGGTLIVRNITIDFVQFVGSTGTAAGRLSHIYRVSVQGTASFSSSYVTTDTQVLNAYPKLFVNVTGGGQLLLSSTIFAFPGWINVAGAGSSFWTNASSILPNPGVALQHENGSLKHDASYAPSLTISGGASATLGASQYLGSYRDNTTQNGMPGPVPATSSVTQAVTSSTGATWSSFELPTDSENLTRADLYPTIASGSVSFSYQAQVGATAPAGNSFTYGSAYGLGSLTFRAGGGVLTASLSAGAVAAINAGGVAAFLQATGAFGGGSSISVVVGTTNQATPVNITQVAITLVPQLTYDIQVNGAGSRLTVADSAVDLNWNLTPGTPVPTGIPFPYPWGSNKIDLTNGAQGFFANVSVPTPRVGTFWNSSAIVPDPTSFAAFYRWAAVPIYSTGTIPIGGAQLTAFYAYDSNQLNNQSANWLNAFGTTDPDLQSYVTAWVALHHLTGYGLSSAAGVASLLLASSNVTQGTLPDGTVLGGYHVAIKIPGGGSAFTQWAYVGLSPYPNGMSPTAGPDRALPVSFPNYRPSLGVGSVLVAANGAVSTSVPIGETLKVTATVTDTGTGPVNNFTTTFAYLQPSPKKPTFVATNQSFGVLGAGASRTVNFSWLVTENVTGRIGTIHAVFEIDAAWNGGVGPNAGLTTDRVNVTILPALITLTFNPPTGNLNPSQEYLQAGTIHYAGSDAAIINATAIGPGGAFFLGQAQATPGAFTLGISPPPTIPAGTYTLNISAFYNGRTSYLQFTNQFTVGGGAAPPPSFLNQKILGQPLWLILLVIAIAIVAIVAALVMLRMTARGKLVECGECGELIPENATSCPKCGAEFEADLVRCSRCGSTIPANSQVCPECAAQLLGKAEEESRDPERQGYADYVERFRTEAKKELADNYGEGAFWDWWKRQPTYIPFSQWRLQQAQGIRTGMTGPVVGSTPETTPASTPPPRAPPRGGAGGTAAPARSAPPPARPPSTPPPAARSAPSPAPAASAAAAGGAAMPATAGMKPCSNCGKEIPPDYLVCPFCGAVTR